MVHGVSGKPHYSIYPEFTKEELAGLDTACKARDVSRAWLMGRLIKVLAADPRKVTAVLQDGGIPPMAREPGQQRFYPTSRRGRRPRAGVRSPPAPENAPVSPGTVPDAAPDASGGLVPPDPAWEAQFSAEEGVPTACWGLTDEQGRYPDCKCPRAQTGVMCLGCEALARSGAKL